MIVILTFQNGLVKVGSVDCMRNKQLCEDREIHTSKTLYYSSSPSKTESPLLIESLNNKEIASVVLHQLPEDTLLDEDAFQVMLFSWLKIIDFIYQYIIDFIFIYIHISLILYTIHVLEMFDFRPIFSIDNPCISQNALFVPYIVPMYLRKNRLSIK